MRLVTTGTMPQREQTWKSAVRVPKVYVDTSAGSSIDTCKAPRGFEVQTPPCLVQNEQPQARAWISTGSGSQVSAKEMLPQWHLPWISTPCPRAQRTSTSSVHCGGCLTVQTTGECASAQDTRSRSACGATFPPGSCCFA